MKERSSQERRNRKPIPIRKLTQMEVTQHIEGDNKPSYLISEQDVMGLNIGGVNLLFVDINHQDKSLDTLTRTLIEHPKTSGVFVEYSGEELTRNGIINPTSRLIRNYQAIRPLVQERLTYAQNLDAVCKEARKPVFVADIANKPLYMLYNALFYNRRIAAIGGVAALATDHILLGLSLLAWSLNSQIHYMLRDDELGRYNPESIGRFERLLPDLEQARRLFVAKGIEQQVQQMIASTPGEDKGTLVVLYPQASSRRIMDMLEHPKKTVDTTRDLMYRGMAPFLDHALRRYDVNEDGEWSPVKRTRIKIIPRRPKLSPATETN